MQKAVKDAKRILIDADGCPVVQEAVSAAREAGAECVILCDTSHEYHSDYARIVVLSKGADSVDYALVNLARAGDLVVTQDYGLAAMCLAKQAVVLDQNGRVYNNQNMLWLLEQRSEAKKIRAAGGRLSGPKKRRSEQDAAFVETIRRLLSE